MATTLDRTQAACLYRETRLNLDPTSEGTVIRIYVPGASPRKPRFDDPSIRHDEETFARQHLASEGSIYFGRHQSHPRSFLWRILEDGKVLELQCVDLTRQRNQEKEQANLTLRLHFGHAIRQGCVGLATPDELGDVLDVFAVTCADEIHTLRLRKDIFIRPKASEGDPSSWCTKYIPSSFSFRHPYRLFAVNTQEVFVSLHDGGLLRLRRKAGDDGTKWRETSYTEGGWSLSLRGFIPWKGHNTVRYGSLELEAGTVTSVALSTDRKHVLTVCLDHSFKAWDLETGHVAWSVDLLGEERRDQRPGPQYLIDPSKGRLLQVFQVHGAGAESESCAITYSPKGHQFKIWNVSDTNSPPGVRDAHPELELIPPFDEFLDTTIWSLEEFHVKATASGRNMELWTLVRTGARSQVYCLPFNSFSPTEEFRRVWRNNWVSADGGSGSAEALKDHPDIRGPQDLLVSQYNNQDPTSVTERYLDFLFYPGRFSVPTLETALHVYQASRSQTHKRSTTGIRTASLPLRQRLCSVVAAEVSLERAPDGSMDYRRYELETSMHWATFVAAVRDLHQRREEVVSLVVDPLHGLPWLVLSDFTSAIRSCSELEILTLNPVSVIAAEGIDPMDTAVQDDHSTVIGHLLHAAASLRSTFSKPVQQRFASLLAVETLQDLHDNLGERMALLYQGCGISISDKDYDRLMDNLRGLGEDGFELLQDNLFQLVLDRLDQVETGHATADELTGTGAAILVRGAQETLQLSREVLLDLVVLVLFATQEVDRDDLPAGLHCEMLYGMLLDKLKQVDVLSWLAGKERQEVSRPRRRGSTSTADSTGSEQPMTVTMLETLFMGDWGWMRFPEEPRPSLLTYWCRAWLSYIPLADQYNGITAYAMADMIKHGETQMAADFLRFMSSDPWSDYVRGRLYLANGELTVAAFYFKDASDGLSSGRPVVDVRSLDRASLVLVDQYDYFNDGKSKYYQHVLSLFEKGNAQTYVADFARLALESLEATCTDGTHTEHYKATYRADILSRLFHASISIQDYTGAFQALTKYTKKDLQRPALQTLVTLLATRRAPLLLALPIAAHRLQKDVDTILLEQCRKMATEKMETTLHQILYAYRIAHNDFRGAASILYERQTLLKKSPATLLKQPDALEQGYLILTNTLASMSPEEAWTLAELPATAAASGTEKDPVEMADGFDGRPAKKKSKRKVITLEDVRREYQDELDRVAAVESGRFALADDGDADEMDMF